MTWWLVILIFIGIPTALYFLIWWTVDLLCEARVPDGLVEAQQLRAAQEQQQSTDEDDGDPPPAHL